MKEVNWQWDYGVYVPFCPYCNEPAYEKEKCVFCKKKFKWTEGEHKTTVVEYGKYTIVQSTDNNIFVYYNECISRHIACTEKLSRKELINIAMKENN